MNARHSKVTDWGLSHVPIEKSYAVLDVGCGGGRTVSKLAATATEGRVYGVDYSNESVTVSNTLLLIAEIYKGANTATVRLAQKYATLSGMALLSADEHRELLATAGYTDIQVNAVADKGWICCVGKKPAFGREMNLERWS